MTQEDKELLLKDLCARLPYGVIVRLDYRDGTIVTREMGIGSLHDMMFDNAEGKPYLRPMSSMTEEECKELAKLDESTFDWYTIPNRPYCFEIATYKQINWLLQHHFDFMGLIPKELAIEVTESNNPYKE